MHFVLPLGTTTDSLAMLGGKGRSLARLGRAGFNVPDGFHITTGAYAAFVSANDLKLPEAAVPDAVDGTLTFDAAAARIETMFAEGAFPPTVADQIVQAYGPFAREPVAVRSSATAEDLPELSFAGQHDTYLDIRGRDALLDAVRKCWASLYSARAMAYRHDMGIELGAVAMAVVVQRLIDADVSGILFTANPATGEPGELVVNSGQGLGEAIVGGEVDPDYYIVDRESLTVTSSTIRTNANQATASVAGAPPGAPLGKVATERPDAGSLSETLLRRLGIAALEVERHFRNVPQDIEWSYAGDELWLLQARPITNLPPTPLKDVSWEPPEPGAYLSRSQLVEHIPDPVSTLFEDLHMRRSLQHYWGMNLVDRGNHRFEDTQPPACFVVQTTINGFAYRHLGEPPRSARHNRPEATPSRPAKRTRKDRWRQRWRMVKHANLAVPRWRYGALPLYLATIRRWRRLDPAQASNAQLWAGVRALSMAEARYWYRHGVWNAFSLARGTEYALASFLDEQAPGTFTSGQFLSGLASPAFDAQLLLSDIARDIRSDSNLHALAVATPPGRLLAALRTTPGAGTVCESIVRYLDYHGHQIFTLDFAEPCEAEQQEELARTLHGLVLDASFDPVGRQHQLAEKRQAALSAALAHFERPQRRRFKALLRRARRFYPNRERAMFHMGRAWMVLRPFAGELGRRLVAAGTLAEAEDIYFLTTAEVALSLRALRVGEGIPGYRGLVRERRSLREARRHLAPPAEVPGPPPWVRSRAPTDRTADPSVIEGSAVSPGRITAAASLVLSMADFPSMRPGTILVCPTTTPAWTQLFPKAVGLVTDIGGILAHGSIVAREYGIPAVLGVGDATRRIAAGQRITVDGDRGTVELLDS